MFLKTCEVLLEYVSHKQINEEDLKHICDEFKKLVENPAEFKRSEINDKLKEISGKLVTKLKASETIKIKHNGAEIETKMHDLVSNLYTMHKKLFLKFPD